MKKPRVFRKLFIIFIIATTLFSSSFFINLAYATSLDKINLNDYIAYFYNRYSQHFDKYGLAYKAPGYGVLDFKQAQTAREILSLATYYKYRALRGEARAKFILRAAILNARYELNSRSAKTYSFSDAWAQLAMLDLLKVLPKLLTHQEKEQLYSEISSRIKPGILAPDSSNRAILGAVYWQIIVNDLFNKKLISLEKKQEYNQLIYHKLSSAIQQSIAPDGWYLEGRPLKFNPHYHMVTASALMVYADITNDIQAYLLAKKMTVNLRSVSFPNGMVEARLGQRPVGLGAQFYLGIGLLNYRFGFKDYAAYFNYATGDRFFSDLQHPNRLEYHTTIYNSKPNYHDDISFSNLAELVLKDSYLTAVKINPAIKFLTGAKPVVDYKDLEAVQVDDDYSLIKKKPQKLGEAIRYRHTSVGHIYNYGQPRLTASLEDKKIEKFLAYCQPYHLKSASRDILLSAYLYGGYTLPEILDTILHGPRAVHPTIPAIIWRHSVNYQKYLHQQ